MQFNMAGVSVMLAMPVHRDLHWAVVKSLLATQEALHKQGIPYEIQWQVGGSIVETARSKIAWNFLKSGKSHLFWVDSDIVWEPQDFLRLLALCTKVPIVGALYPAKKDPPVFYISTDKPEVDADEYGCLDVKGMGLGFTCVYRGVMAKLADKAPVLVFPDADEPIPHIFRNDSVNGMFRGEDMAFFSDCRDLGVTVRVDPTVKLGHVGSKIYQGDLSEAIVRQ